MKNKVLQADIPSYKGPCLPTWLASSMANRFSGGVTGFFKPAKKNFLGVWRKYGNEFHGKIVVGADGKLVVKSTEGMYR